MYPTIPAMLRRNTSACFAAVATLLVLSSVAVGQEVEGGVSEQLWLDYNPRWTDPSHREIYGDVGLRTELGANEWVRFVARPGFRGPVGPFRLSGGIGTSYTVNKRLADRLEMRPFQGTSVVWPSSSRVRLSHYLRLEERLEWETNDWTLDVSLRGRYRLQLDYSFSGFSSSSNWRAILHIEGFLTIAGNAGQLDERLRVGAGLGRNVGSAVRLRADFTWQKIDFNLFGACDQLYIRLRVFQGWLRRLTSDDG